MSMNYYLEQKCPHCGHAEQIHLGKSSIGWTFTFCADRENGVVDYASWLERIDRKWEEGWIIVNEYGDPVIRHELLELIKSKRNEKSSHADYVKADPRYSAWYDPNKDWMDDDGNSFTEGEFS